MPQQLAPTPGHVLKGTRVRHVPVPLYLSHPGVLHRFDRASLAEVQSIIDDPLTSIRGGGVGAVQVREAGVDVGVWLLWPSFSTLLYHVVVVRVGGRRPLESSVHLSRMHIALHRRVAAR